MSTRIASVFAVAGLVLAGIFESSMAQERSGRRQLAPGVLTDIPPAVRGDETSTGPMPIVEIVKGMSDLDWTPNYASKSQTLREKARHVVFRRDIWALQFSFKPMRMIEVDVPQPSGKMQRKRIWYMVYRVRNTGAALSPKGTEDQWGQTVHDVERVNYDTRRFFPHFVLRSQDYEKEYLDRVIPQAQAAIQRREDPGSKLYNSVEMSRVALPLAEGESDGGVWGVVTWEDVDPRVDFFSVFVRGLTNASQLHQDEEAYEPGDPPGTGQTHSFKTLQLNFWRPGDTVFEHEKEFRYGVPIDSDPEVQQQLLDEFGLDERLDHLWVYR